MKECDFQNIFKEQFSDIVFQNKSWTDLPTRIRNGIKEPILWNWNKKKAATVAADLAYKVGNSVVLMELKTNVALGFNMCGYLLASKVIYKRAHNLDVNVFIVTMQDIAADKITSIECNNTQIPIDSVIEDIVKFYRSGFIVCDIDGRKIKNVLIYDGNENSNLGARIHKTKLECTVSYQYVK